MHRAKRNRINISMPQQLSGRDLKEIINKSDGKIRIKRLSIELNEAQAKKLDAIKQETGLKNISSSRICTLLVLDYLLAKGEAQFEDLTNIPQKFMPTFERFFNEMKRFLESSKVN